MRIRFRTSPQGAEMTRRVPRRSSRHSWLPDSGGVFDDCRGELALIAERRVAERSVSDVNR